MDPWYGGNPWEGRRVQSSACTLIFGALLMTPTSALEIILHFSLLDLYCKALAAMSGRRNWAIDPFLISRHTKALNDFEAIKHVDCLVQKYDSTRNFPTLVSAIEAWGGSIADLVSDSVQVFANSWELGWRQIFGVTFLLPPLDLYWKRSTAKSGRQHCATDRWLMPAIGYIFGTFGVKQIVKTTRHCSVFQAEISAM